MYRAGSLLLVVFVAPCHAVLASQTRTRLQTTALDSDIPPDVARSGLELEAFCAEDMNQTAEAVRIFETIENETLQNSTDEAGANASAVDESIELGDQSGDQSLNESDILFGPGNFLNCPPGSYLEGGLGERKHRLRKAVKEMFNRGYMTYRSNPHGSHGRTDTFKKRGYATFESYVWPKPAKCDLLSPTMQYQEDRPPVNMFKWVNDGIGAEFHSIWKVASTSFPQYLMCEFGKGWKKAAVNAPVKKGAHVGVAVRDPVGRWVSGMGEILERVINDWCIHRPCTNDGEFDMDKIRETMRKTTSWFPMALDGEHLTGKPLEKMIRNMVRDSACAYKTYGIEHTTTQSTFMTQNPDGYAHPTDVLVKLEKTDTDLPRMAKAFKGKDARAKCGLSHANSRECKPGSWKIPNAQAMMDVLDHNKDLMQSLCLIYAQDYICLGYDLPHACKGLF